MKFYAPFRVRAEKDIVTRVIRVLKGKGRFNVKVNQQVVPEEIIGNSEVTSGFRVLNLSSLLAVPPHQVSQYLTRNLGQRIYKDELVAFKKGSLFKGQKLVVSPTDGILDFLNNETGDLRISLLPKRIELPAGVYGIVEEVDGLRGQVVIRTQVTQIHGILGSGRPRDGILHILDRKDDMISKSIIQPKHDGHILVGGSLFFKDTITAALSTGISGFICGGINAEDYRGMVSGRLVVPQKMDNDIGIGIVVCEGFGSVSLGGDILNILSEYEGKFIFIEGNKALINLPSSSPSSLTKVKNTSLPVNSFITETNYSGIQQLEIGVNVRIVGNFYFGEQGKVIAIDNSPTLLPSKIKTYLATIETLRRKIQVPVANLEIIM